MQVIRDDTRSLGELFGELSRETSTLVREEVKLAKAEMTQKLKTAAKDIAYLAAGGFIAYAGFLVLLMAVVALLALVIPVWLSALIVGIVVAAVGYFLIQKGLDGLKKGDLAPNKTIETLKEDKEWLQEQLT